MLQGPCNKLILTGSIIKIADKFLKKCCENQDFPVKSSFPFKIEGLKMFSGKFTSSIEPLEPVIMGALCYKQSNHTYISTMVECSYDMVKKTKMLVLHG